MDQTSDFSISLLVLNIILNISLNLFKQLYMLCVYLTLMSWVSKLTMINKSTKSFEALVITKRSLRLYKKLDEGMGSFFFMLISSAQITWIIYIFLSISMMISGENQATDIVTCLSIFVSAMATMLMASSFVFCLSDCHNSLENLGDTLTYDILEMEPGRERQEAKVLLKVRTKCHKVFDDICIQKLESVRPLTHKGFDFGSVRMMFDF